MIIYLDESGDLGFDFENKSPSNYFVITLLVCDGKRATDSFKVAVKRALKNKLNHKKSRRKVQELHATQLSLSIKKYFYKQIKCFDWQIYTISLNKRNVYEYLTNKVGRKKLYNYLAKKIIEKVDFNHASPAVTLIVDKCKNKAEIEDFNRYLENQLEGELPLKTSLNVYHEDSMNSFGLQAVDLFCWGVFRKYERQDMQWYDIYKKQIQFETEYLR
ncbi:MAG: DUF3800 domain-containing protein [Proteobacteria bacterium]|nr:DUF3800 domain-containing protein [Pseudomonadota bacterium]